MTDTTADPGTIRVVGQRRAPGGTFPTGGSGGGAGDDGGIHQNEVSMEDPDPPSQIDPCADPATALPWNADAAAAEAAKEFARLAAAQNPPEDLNKREWGAYLYRNADGSVRIGPINSGPEFLMGGVGTVSLIEGGSPGDIVGLVHSHSSGNHLPSSGNDQEPGDIQVLDATVAYSGRSDVLMYIVAPNQGPVGHTPYNQINVYNQSNARSARDSFTPGPEVNPNGQPCN